MKKFKTKRGHNTIYAFICGWTEEKTINANNYAVLTLNGTWHVKGLKHGLAFWHVFERNETAKARKCFNNCLK